MLNENELKNSGLFEEFSELVEQMESMRSESRLKSGKKWYQMVIDAIVFIVNKVGDVAITLIVKAAELVQKIGTAGLFSKAEKSFG